MRPGGAEKPPDSLQHLTSPACGLHRDGLGALRVPHLGRYARPAQPAFKLSGDL